MNERQKLTKKRTTLILLTTALVIIIGVGFGLWQYKQASEDTASKTIAGYQTTAVRRGNVALTISGSGEVVSSESADLGFPVSGTLAELNVQLGDQVTKGQVLATLEGIENLELKVKEQELAVEIAQNTLDKLLKSNDSVLAQALYDKAAAEETYAKAKANLHMSGDERCDQNLILQYYFEYRGLEKRIQPWQEALDSGKTGYGRDFILEMLQPLWKQYEAAYANYTYCQTYTSQEVEDSHAALKLAKAKMDQATRIYEKLKTASGADNTEIEIAQATLENAKSQLTKAQYNLAGATIVAPMDGVVTDVIGTVGQKVKQGQEDESNNTGTILTITDMSQPKVEVNIDETDLQNFAVGCGAQVTFTALSGQTFSGTVTQVMPTLETVQEVGMLQGVIELEKTKTATGKTLPLGLTASAEITCQASDDALIAPAQALYEPEGEPIYVYILNSQNQPEKREVTVGIQTVASAEILNGLSEGDRVITSQVEGK